MKLSVYLELATYLTNEWSLCSEVKEDMGITEKQLSAAITGARVRGINIEKHLGKIRLDADTSIDQVRLAVHVSR